MLLRRPVAAAKWRASPRARSIISGCLACCPHLITPICWRSMARIASSWPFCVSARGSTREARGRMHARLRRKSSAARTSTEEGGDFEAPGRRSSVISILLVPDNARAAHRQRAWGNEEASSRGGAISPSLLFACLSTSASWRAAAISGGFLLLRRDFTRL